jgi:gamma-glutamyl-gamma-aminobutyraldehyde dehydrogenase
VPGGTARFTVINPATGAPLCGVAAGGAADIDLAVASARRTFSSRVWRRMAPRDRLAILSRLAQLIAANAERFSLLDSLSMGKPIRDMLAIDVPSATQTFSYFAELSDKIDALSDGAASDAFPHPARAAREWWAASCPGTIPC